MSVGCFLRTHNILLNCLRSIRFYGTRITRHAVSGTLETSDWNLQDWIMSDKVTGVEFAGLEFSPSFSSPAFSGNPSVC